ncbi:hypothetical protein [Holmes Jungle virus]|uniref:Uncharacterized protein n=1 Tax=Holmes Jungle virus TaxID=2021721 RepID=A0A221LCF6_9RHAB|nr:hypothetical protein KM638_gp4 [Holmes Jungle virus]ASM90774.1 hypothetical protein [Holmes Jungle virus]
MATDDQFDPKLAWVVESLDFSPTSRDEPVNFVISVKIDVEFPSSFDEIELLMHVRQNLKRNKEWTKSGTLMGLCAGIGLSHSTIVPSEYLRKRLVGEFMGVINIPLIPDQGTEYIVLDTTSYDLDLDMWSGIKLNYTFFVCRGNGNVTKRIDTSWYSGQPNRPKKFTFDLLTVSVLYGFDDWFVSPMVNHDG